MNGVYGTVRPADIDPANDVEIFYSYKRDRGTATAESDKFIQLDASILNTTMAEDNSKLSGMYNLKLPIDKFNKKGIYTIYIKPKEFSINISDVGSLSAFPDVRGIVLKADDLKTVKIDDLVGYRIILANNEERMITSSNYCQYTNDGYRFTDASSKTIFCTVTPSTASSFKPKVLPYIGQSEEKITLINTKFNPVMLELELVDHDIETLSYSIEGSQIRDLDKGKIVTFNDNNEIYSLHDYFTLKDKLGEPLYDVKKKSNSYDSKGDDYNNILKQ